MRPLKELEDMSLIFLVDANTIIFDGEEIIPLAFFKANLYSGLC